MEAEASDEVSGDAAMEIEEEETERLGAGQTSRSSPPAVSAEDKPVPYSHMHKIQLASFVLRS